jgi:PIN domain nuclease of toxin-antitoxin system
MNYLLDTHSIIWLIEDSKKLPSKIKDIVADSDNEVYISSASLWEMAIKLSIGKLELSIEFEELLAIIEECGFSILQIKNDYLIKLLSLPFIHNDPFDRLIISTALSENLTIITVDNDIQKYNVSWVWK